MIIQTELRHDLTRHRFSKNAEHGGFNYSDTNTVVLIVSNPKFNPQVSQNAGSDIAGCRYDSQGSWELIQTTPEPCSRKDSRRPSSRQED